ncbi:hypothetical protein GCM10027030_13550 [Luteococcus sediminum]
MGTQPRREESVTASHVEDTVASAGEPGEQLVVVDVEIPRAGRICHAFTLGAIGQWSTRHECPQEDGLGWQVDHSPGRLPRAALGVTGHRRGRSSSPGQESVSAGHIMPVGGAAPGLVSAGFPRLHWVVSCP